MKAKLFTSMLFLFLCYNLFSQPQQFTWNETNSPVTTRLNGIDAFGQYMNFHFWFCGNNGVVLKTTNNGSTYINRTGNGIPINVNLITIAIFDTNIIVTGGFRNDTTFVYRTTNGGLNWQSTFSQAGGFINAINEKVSYPRQAQIGFMTGNPVGGRWSLWRTTNSGTTWDSTGKNVAQAGIEAGFPGSLIYLDSLILFGTNNGRIYRSTNHGNLWTAQILTGEQFPTAFQFNAWPWPPYIRGDVGGLSTMQSTTNGGLNWSNNPNLLAGSGRILALVGHPAGVFDYMFSDGWYVRNDNKVYHSGGQWQAQYTAPSGNYTYISEGNQTSVYIAAIRDNGGISFCNCQIWGAVRNLGGYIPKDYILSQNYPNPFNPATTIKFSLPVKSLAAINVYNSLGALVTSMVKEELGAGNYEITWDAGKFASGIYYYKLQTDKFSETKKMVLVK